MSTGNKQVRKPKKDGWYEHGQNCAEYLELTFGLEQRKPKVQPEDMPKVHVADRGGELAGVTTVQRNLSELSTGSYPLAIARGRLSIGAYNTAMDLDVRAILRAIESTERQVQRELAFAAPRVP